MKIMCVIFLVVSSSLAAFNIDLWQNLRFSEKTSEGNVYIRTEIDQTNINTNKLVYASGGSLTEMDFSGLRPGTYQAMAPAGTGRTYYGLRRQAGSAPNEVVPLRYTGTALPAPGLLTKVSDDPPMIRLLTIWMSSRIM